MELDYILKGGVIVDGESAASSPREADVGIRGDRIEAIGDLSNVDAANVVDVAGLRVCPGFIDSHAHSEFTLLADGRAQGKICQGVTTEINGNCGLSAAPLYGPALERRIPEIRALDIRETWNTFREYFELLARRGIAVNFVTLVGHGNLRGSVAGYADRQITANEKNEILGLLSDSLQAGARGLSAGLVYPPGMYADTSELCWLAAEAAKRKGSIYTTHMRSEGDELLEAVDETIRIGLVSSIPVHISHIKTYDKRNWHKLPEVFGRIQRAREQGLRVTCDRYPYTASGTSLDVVLPAWAFEGGDEEEMKRLTHMRKELERDMMKTYPDASCWEDVRISSVVLEKNRWMEGRSIAEIAGTSRKKPAECVFDILTEERLRVDAVFFAMSEENLKAILEREYVTIGTDSAARGFDGITAKGKPHPRGFGSFPRVLKKYVKETGIITEEEAVYRMTGLPAGVFSIRRRGVIRKGYFADITVYDPEGICDMADFDAPFARPRGIYCVFVNGVPALLNGELTGALPGKILGQTAED